MILSGIVAACADVRALEEHAAPVADAPDATAPRAPLASARNQGTLTQRSSLVDSELWQVMPAAADPFADRPEDAACPDGSHMAELLSNENVFSVDTGGCTYLTAQQPSLRDVAMGEMLAIRVWHFALNAGQSAMAHVAVRLGEITLLDATVPIPAPGGLLHVEQTAPAPVRRGTPIYFHLHNHGDNSWSFVELSAGP